MIKKKLGIDFTYIKEDKVSGIRKYGEEILEGVSKLNDEYEIVLFINKKLENIYKDKFSEHKVISIKEYFYGVRYISRIFKILYKYYIKRDRRK